MITYKLKYLFEAEFIDGTVFKQNLDDQSELDPKRNAYYDLVQSGKKIRRFSLVGNGNRITVDLGTGIFYVNKLPVIIECEKLPCLPDKFELIRYNDVKQTMKVTYNTLLKKIIKVIKNEHEEPFVEYYIGWQCTINGKNYQAKIAVS